MKDFMELVVSLAVAAIPIIGAFVSKHVVSNKKAVAVIQAIEPLAKTAVAAAEQLGVTDQLSGAAKKSEAVASVQSALKSLNLTAADEKLISDTVEKAYMDMKDQIHSAYTASPAVDDTSTTTTTIGGSNEGNNTQA